MPRLKITKRLQKAASIYPNRSFGTKNDIKIQKILQKAEKRKQELKEAGIKADLIREEPFDKCFCSFCIVCICKCFKEE